MMPTFLVIGAAKAGTTSIHAALSQHPEVFVPAIKEPHFFALEQHPEPFRGPGDDYLNRYGVRTLAEYEALFAKAGPASARGEASPWYLYMDGVADNIASRCPETRLVAILRNPVDRAFSSYLHVVRDGREPLSFNDGLAAEPERIESGWEPIWHYVAAGMYAERVAEFQSRFGERLKLFLYEDVQSDLDRVLAETYFHIGVDPDFKADTTARLNTTGVPTGGLGNLVFRQNPIKSALRAVIPAAIRQKLVAASGKLLTRPEMDCGTRKRLAEVFAPDVERLQAMIGRDLSRWRA